MSDSQMIRFGIVGSGKITRSFLAAANECEGCTLAAISSRREEKGRAYISSCLEKGLADPNRTIFVFTDPLEMALSGAIDAAYIASPTAKHFEQAKLFLREGIPVLCEKPFVTNAREAEELLRLAKENSTFIMEAMRSLPMPGFRAIRENLPKLGRIRRVVASKCQYSSRYDRFKEGIVENAFKKELSNGALMDIGRYCVAPVAELFGEPLSLEASAHFLHTGVDAQGSAILHYEDFDAILLYSKVSDSFLPFEIQGENGTLTADDIYEFRNARIHFRDGTEETLLSSDTGRKAEAASEALDGARHVSSHVMTYEIREFLHCVRGGKTESVLVTPRQILISFRIMDAIRKKIRLSYPADHER